MNTRVYIDKYCDEAARYTAEFELRGMKVTERSVITVDISCFAPTRSKAKADLRKTLNAVISELKGAIEGLP